MASRLFPEDRYCVFSYIQDDCVHQQYFRTVEHAFLFCEQRKLANMADSFYVTQFCPVHRTWAVLGRDCPHGVGCLHAYDNFRDSLINLREWAIQILEELEEGSYSPSAAITDLVPLEDRHKSVLARVHDALAVLSELSTEDDEDFTDLDAEDMSEYYRETDKVFSGEYEANPFGSALDR